MVYWDDHTPMARSMQEGSLGIFRSDADAEPFSLGFDVHLPHDEYPEVEVKWCTGTIIHQWLGPCKRVVWEFSDLMPMPNHFRLVSMCIFRMTSTPRSR